MSSHPSGFNNQPYKKSVWIWKLRFTWLEQNLHSASEHCPVAVDVFFPSGLRALLGFSTKALLHFILGCVTCSFLFPNLKVNKNANQNKNLSSAL